MTVERVLVCEVQVPFVHGGAEVLVRQLVRELRGRGYLADLVSIPFKWYPKEEILPHAAAWRLLDLSESNGRPVDLVIASKFPSYFVRHPRKVAWLVHQYRAAYELCGTPFSDFAHTELDVGLRETLLDLDTRMLGECEALFTIARNTAARLEKYNGLAAEVLYHPPQLASRLVAGPYGDYVLSVGRIESIKRVDLIVAAMQHVDPPVRLIVAGDGTHRHHAEAAAVAAGVTDRVTFLGSVGDDDLITLYAGALGIVYPPFDEDFGYVTLEAFLARKPVVTCTDSGGPNEFVVDGANGYVCVPAADALAVVYPPFDEDFGYVTLEAFLARKPVITCHDSGGPNEFVIDGVNGRAVDPSAEALAEAINDIAADKTRAARLGDAGRLRAQEITWDGVIEKLVP